MTSVDDIKKQLKKQDNDFYGDQAAGGHNGGSDDETFSEADKPLEEFSGEKATDFLDVEGLIEDAEKRRRDWPESSDPKAELIKEPDKRLERIDEAEKIDYLEEDTGNDMMNE